MNAFDSMMAAYSIQSDADYQNALHEVMQKVECTLVSQLEKQG